LEKNNPETLKYLVVDELHTFDGAQGTDLACLIRRLKMRLNVPENHLCCVGTSATLGDDSSGEKLAEYAEGVFGQPFSKGAIIAESRLTAGEYLADEEASVEYLDTPGSDRLSLLDPLQFDSYQDFTDQQLKLWFPDDDGIGSLSEVENRVLLGKLLKKHGFFQNMLRSMTGKPKSTEQLISDLKKRTRGSDGQMTSIGLFC
jgi:DEAD/DEAH box helicase domain-containing protein